MNIEIQTTSVTCAVAREELVKLEILFSDRAMVSGELIDPMSFFYKLSESTQEHLLSCTECWERYEAIPTHF